MSKPIRFIMSLLFAIILSAALSISVLADEETENGEPRITVEGPVSSINGNIVIVGDISFELSDDDPVLVTLKVGDMVRIQGSGDTDDDEALEVVTVIVTGEPLSSATVTVIGEVEAIDLTIVTVAGYQIQFDAADPMLADLNIGDVIEVSGTTINLGGVIIVVPSSVVIIIVNPDPEETPDPNATPEATPDPNATPEPTPEATPDDDDEGGIIIVIEGPVEEINIDLHIIVIYGIEIQLDEDDPLITVIQIGDIIHVEGDMVDMDGVIIIMVINIVIVNVDIVIDGDNVWRDSGNCGNPPPPWAPAHGWRRKCERRGGGGGSKRSS